MGILRSGFLKTALCCSSELGLDKGGVISPSSLASLSALVVRDDGEDADFRLTGLAQSQKWPVGFGLSSELVVCDLGGDLWDGEDGDVPYPVGIFPPAMPSDWASGCDKDVCPVVGVLCGGLRIRLWLS